MKNKKILFFCTFILLTSNKTWADDLIFDNNPENILIQNPSQINNDEYNFKVGMLFENENTQSNSDKKGVFEQTYYLEYEKDNWHFYGGFYQENHNVSSYYKTKGRDSWFDRYETNLRYQSRITDNIELGLLGGFRYYRWHHRGPENQEHVYNTLRYDIQPDWKVTLTDNLNFAGWLGLFNYYNHIEKNELTDKEIEGETGFNYAFNETFSGSLNYYINQGWNKGSRSSAEFAQQEIRLYFPINLSLFADQPTTLTPYYRHTLDTYHFDDERNKKKHERDRRYGLLLEQNITDRLFISLEYALETQKQSYANEGEKRHYYFHYSGLNLSYRF
ncbi:OmpG family monomeric porin [Providencia sp.]|uniref:OmpG family monomeric porin n=1 Tax=Providencia sp. TaxID=589 RepID=UPI0035B45261